MMRYRQNMEAHKRQAVKSYFKERLHRCHGSQEESLLGAKVGIRTTMWVMIDQVEFFR